MVLKKDMASCISSQNYPTINQGIFWSLGVLAAWYRAKRPFAGWLGVRTYGIPQRMPTLPLHPSQSQSVDGSRSELLTAIRRSNFRLAASSGGHIFYQSISIPVGSAANTTGALRNIQRGESRSLFRSFTVDPSAISRGFHQSSLQCSSYNGQVDSSRDRSETEYEIDMWLLRWLMTRNACFSVVSCVCLCMCDTSWVKVLYTSIYASVHKFVFWQVTM